MKLWASSQDYRAKKHRKKLAERELIWTASTAEAGYTSELIAAAKTAIIAPSSGSGLEQ